MIDPDEPSLRVFELDADGRYQQVAKVAGSEPFDAQRPFPYGSTRWTFSASLPRGKGPSQAILNDDATCSGGR